MTLIAWDDKYSVGVKEIDDEHKELVALLNHIYDAMLAGQPREALGGLLDELIEHTKSHFANEERLMEERRYHEYRQHKEEHEKLADEAIAIKKNIDKGAGMVTLQIVDYLKKWLVDHILSADHKFGEYLLKGFRL